MDKNKLKSIIASELIIIAMENKGKRPTQLNFEEMIDVIADLVTNLPNYSSNNSPSSKDCEYYQHDQCDCMNGVCEWGKK